MLLFIYLLYLIWEKTLCFNCLRGTLRLWCWCWTNFWVWHFFSTLQSDYPFALYQLIMKLKNFPLNFLLFFWRFFKFSTIKEYLILIQFGLVRSGLVWFSTVRFRAIWFSLVWFGSVRFRVVQFGSVQFGLVWFILVQCDSVRFGLVRLISIQFGLVQFSMVQFGLVRFGLFWFNVIWFSSI